MKLSVHGVNPLDCNKNIFRKQIKRTLFYVNLYNMASVFKLIYVPLKIRYIFTILKNKNLYHNVEQTKNWGVG